MRGLSCLASKASLLSMITRSAEKKIKLMSMICRSRCLSLTLSGKHSFFIKEDAPGKRKEGPFLPVLFYKY